MSKKHYVAIARVLSSLSGESDGDLDYAEGFEDARILMAERMADVLGADNPRFDRDRFLRACGVEP